MAESAPPVPLVPQCWEPIESWRDDGKIVLRPHTIWGAMDVRYLKEAVNGHHWVNGDYTTSWPDIAFLPFWMPRPDPPLLSLVPDPEEEKKTTI